MDCLKLSHLLKMSDQEFAEWTREERARTCRNARIMAACVLILAFAVVYLIVDKFMFCQ